MGDPAWATPRAAMRRQGDRPVQSAHCCLSMGVGVRSAGCWSQSPRCSARLAWPPKTVPCLASDRPRIIPTAASLVTHSCRSCDRVLSLANTILIFASDSINRGPPRLGHQTPCPTGPPGAGASGAATTPGMWVQPQPSGALLDTVSFRSAKKSTPWVGPHPWLQWEDSTHCRLNFLLVRLLA